MSDLAQCRDWIGRRVWVRASTVPSGLVRGRVVQAFPMPFEPHMVDLAVRLSSGDFVVVPACEQGTGWDFEDPMRNEKRAVM